VGKPKLRPIPFKSLPAPFLRLIPTISEYARLTAVDRPEVGPDVQNDYLAHLRVLVAFLSTTAEAGELAPEAVDPLVHRCEDMATQRGAELAETFADLVAGMQAVYAGNRDLIRDAIANDPDLFRELYRDGIRPKQILAVYAQETWDRSEKMGTKLSDRCWYDHRRHCESDGMVWLDGTDIVLFAPGQAPIQANIEEAVASAEVPVLVLTGWSKQDDPHGMAELRTENWYRRTGHRVMHGPFPPVRLYQAIDGMHLQHLAWRHAIGRKAAAAAY
jgi:hypothetical protein